MLIGALAAGKDEIKLIVLRDRQIFQFFYHSVVGLMNRD